MMDSALSEEGRERDSYDFRCTADMKMQISVMQTSTERSRKVVLLQRGNVSMKFKSFAALCFDLHHANQPY